MKLVEIAKSNQTKAHLIALILYVLGFVFDAYGYINVGFEALGYVFLGAFTGYGSSLAIIWYMNNKRLLKAAKWHFVLLFIGLPLIFITWFKHLYPTFGFTICFMSVIGILFIINLCRISSAYYYDVWK